MELIKLQEKKMAIEIYNGTQHEINIYDLADTFSIEDGRKLIVKEGASPIMVIAAGKNLNCVKGNAKMPSFEVQGLPQHSLKGAVTFISFDHIPPEAEGKVVIVSNLYRSAVKELGGNTSMFATVDGVVYSSPIDKKPIGCIGLAIG